MFYSDDEFLYENHALFQFIMDKHDHYLSRLGIESNDQAHVIDNFNGNFIRRLNRYLKIMIKLKRMVYKKLMENNYD